ncbi:MAG TPA: hypothetical protein VK158_04410 [Acidobacteriota bacterium]|nr:hypothetical protein [Acidobacteriota bacterium]
MKNIRQFHDELDLAEKQYVGQGSVSWPHSQSRHIAPFVYPAHHTKAQGVGIFEKHGYFQDSAVPYTLYEMNVQFWVIDTKESMFRLREFKANYSTLSVGEYTKRPKFTLETDFRARLKHAFDDQIRQLTRTLEKDHKKIGEHFLFAYGIDWYR